MKKVRSEAQNFLLLGASAPLFSAMGAQTIQQMLLVGFNPFQSVLATLMIIFAGFSAWGFLEALTVYEFDDERVTRRSLLGQKSISWRDVADLRIRRSGGDSVVFLRDKRGKGAKIDFQLLGLKGKDLFELFTEKVRPLVSEKVADLDRTRAVFRNFYMAFIPVSGSVWVDHGVVGQGRGAAESGIPVGSVSEVSAKLVKSLTPSQEYLLTGNGRKLRFRSALENSPILLRYLRCRVAEEKWKLRPSSNVSRSKVLGVVMVAVLFLGSLQTLSLQAEWFGTEQAISRDGQEGMATIVAIHPLSPRAHWVSYIFTDAKKGEIYSESIVKMRAGAVPPIGEEIPILFSKENPSDNRPLARDGFEPVAGNIAWLDLIGLPALGLFWIVSLLAFRARDDPFLPWITS